MDVACVLPAVKLHVLKYEPFDNGHMEDVVLCVLYVCVREMYCAVREMYERGACAIVVVSS